MATSRMRKGKTKSPGKKMYDDMMSDKKKSKSKAKKK